MPREEVLNLLQKYVIPYRVTKGKGFRLKDFDPGDTGGLQIEKAEATHLLQAGTAWLAEEQDMLYAQNRWSLLLVFQAMDAAGKDGTINHVMSGVNPQGCQVFSFKQPSSEEIASADWRRTASGLPCGRSDRSARLTGQPSAGGEVEAELCAPRVQFVELPAPGLHRLVLVPGARLLDPELRDEDVHLGVELDARPCAATAPRAG